MLGSRFDEQWLSSWKLKWKLLSVCWMMYDSWCVSFICLQGNLSCGATVFLLCPLRKSKLLTASSRDDFKSPYDWTFVGTESSWMIDNPYVTLIGCLTFSFSNIMLWSKPYKSKVQTESMFTYFPFPLTCGKSALCSAECWKNIVCVCEHKVMLCCLLWLHWQGFYIGCDCAVVPGAVEQTVLFQMVT